jgi:Zinc carboxypeptidase
MEDIGATIERQELIRDSQASSVNPNDFAYNKYHPIEEIHAWIDTMVQTYPTLATSFTVGQSYEKRDLKGLKISSNETAVKRDGTPVNAKKAVWWDGGKL